MIKLVAIEYQLRLKEQTHTENLSAIIINNLHTGEFFINKAIGWALREYAETNQAWVLNFLQEYQVAMDRLSIREASKKLTK